MSMTHAARLLSHHGRQAWVLCDDGERRLCVYRGRSIHPAANDSVSVDLSADPGVITEIHPRHNEISRSEPHRMKTLAANIDQAVIVISGSPLFSDELLARMICACAAEAVKGVVVLNKTDLEAPSDRGRAHLKAFTQCLSLLGWTVIETSTITHQDHAAHDAQQGIAMLMRQIRDLTSLVMGQSGMGKSSLLNAMVPGLNMQTREISEALQSGKHTTTAAYMVSLPGNTWLIDTPGFQLFGLHHLSVTQLALGFPELEQIREQSGPCRYANCRHEAEPDCRVKQAVEAGRMTRRRWEIWRALLART
jgi:ribosome biogenesis GTPase